MVDVLFGVFIYRLQGVHEAPERKNPICTFVFRERLADLKNQLRCVVGQELGDIGTLSTSIIIAPMQSSR